jgi:hypothetical protein
MNVETELVYTRAARVLEMLTRTGAPLDKFTATALVMSGALMAKVSTGYKITREEWLATCASVFDTADAVAKEFAEPETRPQ